MATDTGVKIEGLNRVVRDLQRAGIEVTDLKDAMASIAAEVKPDYQGVTPRKSGALRADYRTGKAKGKAVLYVGRARIPYAAPLNYGNPNRGIKARKFVEKGDAIAAPKAFTSLEQEISRLLERLNLT